MGKAFTACYSQRRTRILQMANKGLYGLVDFFSSIQGSSPPTPIFQEISYSLCPLSSCFRTSHLLPSPNYLYSLFTSPPEEARLSYQYHPCSFLFYGTNQSLQWYISMWGYLIKVWFHQHTMNSMRAETIFRLFIFLTMYLGMSLPWYVIVNIFDGRDILKDNFLYPLPFP